jgi:hypothetical protein
MHSLYAPATTPHTARGYRGLALGTRNSARSAQCPLLVPLQIFNFTEPLLFLAASEERCRGDNSLQIFVRDRVNERDTKFIGDKPVRLL